MTLDLQSQTLALSHWKELMSCPWWLCSFESVNFIDSGLVPYQFFLQFTRHETIMNSDSQFPSFHPGMFMQGQLLPAMHLYSNPKISEPSLSHIIQIPGLNKNICTLLKAFYLSVKILVPSGLQVNKAPPAFHINIYIKTVMFYAVNHQPSEISEHISSRCGFPKHAEVSLTKYTL